MRRLSVPLAFVTVSLSLGLSLALSLGCSRGTTSAQPTPMASTATPGTLALGERITSPLVPLAEVAKNPSHFEGQVFATSGKVTAVCQEMGCWMQLEDASGRAHVRMHGHTFFVPKTSSGHLARVQGTLVKPAGGADDCEEGKTSAQVELDATGVELD